MPRPDLLALTADDLVTLTNRGTVKRAAKELDSGKVTPEIEEDSNGNVTVRWSDGIVCTIPAGATLKEAQCSSGSMEISRHMVRSVLAYQRMAPAPAARSENSDSADEGASDIPAVPPQEPWNPGEIPDEEIARHYRPAELTKLRNQFEKEEYVLELQRTAKPTVYIHNLHIAFRFLVPGDLRYTHCDCSEETPCTHAPIAVWAFRMLDAERSSGLVISSPAERVTPVEVLERGDELLAKFLEVGLSGYNEIMAGKFRRLEEDLEKNSLVWPAHLIADFQSGRNRYEEKDARFSSTEMASLIGEWLLRRDAIESQTGAIPQLFLRGSAKDRATETDSARYTGLGADARVYNKGAELTAYLQDARSGAVATVSKHFPNPEPDHNDPDPEPRDFHSLSGAIVGSKTSLATFASGQLLIKGAKRTAEGRLQVTRKKISAQPQNYQWELLRPPLLAETLKELQERLALQPPESLRPRRVASNLYVISVSGALNAVYHSVEQAVVAEIRDSAGDTAYLYHPFYSRNASGTMRLLDALEKQGGALRFVAGRVTSGGHGITIHPTAAVFEQATSRLAVLPWIDDARGLRIEQSQFEASNESPRVLNPLETYPAQVLEWCGEIIRIGLARSDKAVETEGRELAKLGRDYGFQHLPHLLELITAGIEGFRSTVQPDYTKPARQLLQLMKLTRLTMDLKLE